MPPNIDVWGWVKYYREPFEIAQQQEKEKQQQKQLQEAAVAAKKAAEKTKAPAKITSKIPPKPKKKPAITDPLIENPQGKRFEQKHLLDNDTELGE